MKVFFLLATFTTILAAQIPQLGAPQPGAPQQALPPNTVVATVGGMPVTIDDVRKMTDNAPVQILQFFRQRPQDFIQQYFLFRHLTEEGDKLKLAEQSPMKEQLQAQRDYVVANAVVGYEQDHFDVTEPQLMDFYNKNQARWQQAKIRAILIGFKPTGGASDSKDAQAAAKNAIEAAHPVNQRSEEEARKLAADIVKQLRTGADFGKLVDQYSDDTTSKQMGGEFPTIKSNSPYPDDMKKAMFVLNNGETGEPIRQPSGFYIVRMDQKSLQPLNDVRETIITEFRQAHRDEWLRDLNKRFTPVVQKPEFFLQPELYVQQATGATTKR